MSLATPTTIRRLQRKLYTAAKAEPARRFHQLYDKLYREDILRHAYASVRAAKGARTPGVDGETFADIEEQGTMRWLAGLLKELRNKTYRPQPVRRVMIPKKGGGQRPLGIPTIRDRVVQTAAKLVLEPIFEADVVDCAYGYRPKRSAQDAVRSVHQAIRAGYTDVVDGDLSKYFDSIPHAELMKSVARRVSDRHMRHLIKMWMEAPVEEIDDRGRHHRTTRNKDKRRGTPQGAPISPLLSNLYMRRFVLGWKRLGHEGRLRAYIVNYADDFVICCRGTAAQAMAAIREMMQGLRLTVNEDKTRRCRVWDESFEFLGYTIGRCYSPKTGKVYIGTKPSQKNISRLCGKISELTKPRWGFIDSEEQVGRINRKLAGWSNYFRLGPVSTAYRAVDQHTAQRLRQWLCKKHKVQGLGITRYPDAYLYRKLNLIRLEVRMRNFAWATA